MMDSLSLFVPLNKSTCLQISKIYSLSKSCLRIQTCSVQQQEGNWDCGLFSIAIAAEICFGNSPELATFNQQMMRRHLLDCFGKRRLTLFPKTSMECIPRPTKSNCIMKLFCTCNMPEEYDSMMIQSNICQKWYHCSCVCIKQSKIPLFWRCYKCSKK